MNQYKCHIISSLENIQAVLSTLINVTDVLLKKNLKTLISPVAVA